MPLYLHHRYQLDAAAKSIGGVYFTYAVRTRGGPAIPAASPRSCRPRSRRRRCRRCSTTLDVDALRIPERILQLIPPTASGYGGGTAELFEKRTDPTFDPIGAATIAADITVTALLQRERAARDRRAARPRRRRPRLRRHRHRAGAATWARRRGRPTATARRFRKPCRAVVVQRLMDLAADTRRERAGARAGLGRPAADQDDDRRAIDHGARRRRRAKTSRASCRGRPTRSRRPIRCRRRPASRSAARGLMKSASHSTRSRRRASAIQAGRASVDAADRRLGDAPGGRSG